MVLLRSRWRRFALLCIFCVPVSAFASNLGSVSSNSSNSREADNVSCRYRLQGLGSNSTAADLRESRSRPYAGIVGVRTRGVNQRAEVVIEFRRTMMIYKRGHGDEERTAPVTTEPWRV